MRELSSIAQAVLAAAQKYEIDHQCYSRQIAAAAIRAAADQVAPLPGRYPMNDYMDGIRDTKQDLHKQLCAIATELEVPQ